MANNNEHEHDEGKVANPREITDDEKEITKTNDREIIPKETQQSSIENELSKQLSIFKTCQKQIDNKWTRILREDKFSSLVQELPQLKEQYTQLILHRKKMEELYLNYLSSTEDQYRVAFGTYHQNIQHLVQLHENNLLQLERDFTKQLDIVVRKNKQEHQDLKDHYQERIDRVLKEISTILTDEQKMIEGMQKQRQNEIEEIKNKDMDDINSLRFDIDNRTEELEEQADITKSDFIQKTSHRSETVNKLSLTKQEMNREMAALQHQIDQLKQSIKRLKNESYKNEIQAIDKNENLLVRKNHVIDKYKETKEKLGTLRNTQDVKLKNLCKDAHNYKAHLIKKIELSERIMKLSSIVKKFETNDEFNNDSVSFSDSRLASDPIQLSCDEMRLFWNKYNNALIDLEHARDTEISLTKRNEDLKKKIKKYEDGISLNDEVLSVNNPLIAINGKIGPKLQKPKYSARRMTVVDANHAFSISHVR